MKDTQWLNNIVIITLLSAHQKRCFLQAVHNMTKYDRDYIPPCKFADSSWSQKRSRRTRDGSGLIGLLEGSFVWQCIAVTREEKSHQQLIIIRKHFIFTENHLVIIRKISRYYGKASYYTNPLCQLCNLSELIHREICRLYCKKDVYIGFIKYFSHSNVYCNKIFISVMRCRAGRYISITSR